MALRQFNYHLIPSSAIALGGMVEAQAGLDWQAAIVLDIDEFRTRALLGRIGRILPERLEVVTGLRVWGGYDSDDVRVDFDKANNIVHVQFRLEARNPSQ